MARTLQQGYEQYVVRTEAGCWQWSGPTGCTKQAVRHMLISYPEA